MTLGEQQDKLNAELRKVYDELAICNTYGERYGNLLTYLEQLQRLSTIIYNRMHGYDG
jgi:hypothetical protein